MASFTRRIEDFICEVCKTEVNGDGFTNHCPTCLWSKHVDNFPGDRENECRGKMRPIDVTGSVDNYVIIHKCESCGEVRSVKSSRFDNFEKLLDVASRKGR